jgi:O-glycosyl hydrolase
MVHRFKFSFDEQPRCPLERDRDKRIFPAGLSMMTSGFIAQKHRWNWTHSMNVRVADNQCRMRMRFFIFIFGAALVLINAIQSSFGADHADVIDLSKKYQVIDNFGASDAWTMQKIGVWSEASKNKIADLLFSTNSGIGLSLWRFNIGGGINPNIRNKWRTAETFEVSEGKYDWARQSNELWFAHAARDRDVPYLLGFVNSPPGRLTKNGRTNSGMDDKSTTNLKAGMEKQFATYLCDIVEHFKNAPEQERLIFNYLSPVNEPEIAWEAGNNQEGNRASNDDIKKVLKAVHDEITARKLDVKIRALEANSVHHLYQPATNESQRWGAAYGDYLKVFCGDPAFAPFLDGVMCYHDYSSFSGRSVEVDHARLGKEMVKYPNIKLWMSETCILQPRRDLTMNMALDVAKLIHADLVLSGASAWHWWLAVSAGDYKDGLLYTDWHRPGDPETILESKSFWALGNYSRFIRPGFVRVELAGDHHDFDGILGSAYMDPNNGRLVLVYINLTDEAQKINWTFKADNVAPTKQFVPWITAADENLKPHPAIRLADGFVMPPRSVVSLVSE